MIAKLLCSKTAQKSLILFTFFILSSFVFSQNEFITTWKTDNPGASNNTSITIPTTGAGYNYDVDWTYDGITFNAESTGVTGNITHNYGASGSYTVAIRGAFPRIYFLGSSDKEKIISIDQWGTGVWTSMFGAFFQAINLVGNATDAPDLSGVTDMAVMFTGATIFNQDISSWDTSTVTSMRAMFQAADTFNNGGQPLNWNTALVTNMSTMFQSASAFNQDIGSWDTSSVTDMSWMFYEALAFNNGGQPLNWNTALVTNMFNMFNGTVFNQDIGGWNTAAVLNMSNMFYNNSSFNQDIGAWNVEKVTDFNQMFRLANTFNNGGQPLSWNTIAATDISFMFWQATAFNQDLSSWNINNVTNYTNMFGNSGYNNGGVPLNWDFSALTSLSWLFSQASAFNIDLSNWDVSNITNFSNMFNNASAYNNGGQQLTWDTTGLTNFSGMFTGAVAFNQDISSWNTSSLTDMNTMFTVASAFNNGGQPLNWDTSAVVNMRSTFDRATVFNQDISNWDTSLVEDMSFMFFSALAFNQNISSWNTTAVTLMDGMFRNASAFNQDIGGWDVAAVTGFSDMFLDATLSDANYDALLIGWDAQNLQSDRVFSGGNSQYCSPAGQAARANIIASDGWTITDGGLFSGTCGLLGLEDNELNSILLYPNPTKGNVTIELNSDASFTLVNMLGQEIEKGTFTFGDNALDISAFAKGLYILTVKANGASATKKIIKQ